MAGNNSKGRPIEIASLRDCAGKNCCLLNLGACTAVHTTCTGTAAKGGPPVPTQGWRWRQTLNNTENDNEPTDPYPPHSFLPLICTPEPRSGPCDCILGRNNLWLNSGDYIS